MATKRQQAAPRKTVRKATGAAKQVRPSRRTPTTMEPAAETMPRQFDQSLAPILLTLAQDGADEIAGPEIEEGHLWAALLRDGAEIARRTREVLEDAQANGEPAVDPGELRALEAAAGVIVTRESEGAVTAQPYASEEELVAAWSTLLSDLEPSEPGSAAVGSPEADENPT